MTSPIDNTISIIRETVPGTTPATPAFKKLEYISADVTYDGKTVNSDTMRANRSLVSSALMNKAGGVSIKCHGRRDSNVDTLWEGLLGNAFSGTTLTPGNTDFPHTVEQIMVEKSTGTAVSSYVRNTNALVSKGGVTVDPSSNVEFSFEMVSAGQTVASAALASATYVDPTLGLALTGNDVGTITIAGLTGTYTSLDLSIEQPREPVFGLGTANAVAVGTSATPRTIKLTVKMLRNGIAINALAGTIVAVSVTLGTGTGNQYTFTMPKMLASLPKNEVSGAAAIVTLELVAVAPLTTDVDLTITKA